MTSTHIPFFSGVLPPRYRRRRYIDGGFSVNQLTLPGDHATLTVSPFSGDAHICPKVSRKHRTKLTRVNFAEAWTDLSFDNIDRITQVMFPSSPEKMAETFLSGYHDAVSFLARYGQIQSSCGTCLTVRTTYSPKDVLKVYCKTFLGSNFKKQKSIFFGIVWKFFFQIRHEAIKVTNKAC